MRSPFYTTNPWQNTYSEVIDVRSEREFGEDCLPGAINLPVLNNQERARVGTLYKQVSPFVARKVGAALIADNIAHHLSTHLADKGKDYAPLIYCWRGGQRSQSLATVLTQIGWHVTLLEGGYKTYRADVRRRLQTLPEQFQYRLLCGLTGSGKTHLLRQLQQQGEQILDLEKLANHRGSLLGQRWLETPQPQPSQKKFESLLLQAFQALDPSQVVWLESESNKIGDVHLPGNFWQTMKAASGVEVHVPLPTRVEWLIHHYPHLMEEPDVLKSKLRLLKARYGGAKLEQWFTWIDQSNWRRFVVDILETHYDPAYQRSLPRTFPKVSQKIELTNLSAPTIVETVNRLKQMPISNE